MSGSPPRAGRAVWLPLGAGYLIGMVYGFGLTYLADLVYGAEPTDISFRGVAAGLFFLAGCVVGVVILAVVAIVTYRSALRRTAVAGPSGAVMATLAPFLGAAAGSLLSSGWSSVL